MGGISFPQRGKNNQSENVVVPTKLIMFVWLYRLPLNFLHVEVIVSSQDRYGRHADHCTPEWAFLRRRKENN